MSPSCHRQGYGNSTWLKLRNSAWYFANTSGRTMREKFNRCNNSTSRVFISRAFTPGSVTKDEERKGREEGSGDERDVCNYGSAR